MNAPHVATTTPRDGGYLVTCPHGCQLGTSAHAPDEHAAAARIQLHKTATTPLIPRKGPVDPELFARSAPQWNCVDYPDGPHYTPGSGNCLWCGRTREQIHAQWDEQEAQR